MQKNRLQKKPPARRLARPPRRHYSLRKDIFLHMSSPNSFSGNRSGRNSAPNRNNGNNRSGTKRPMPQKNQGSGNMSISRKSKNGEEKSNEDQIELEGVVSAVLAGTMFRVKLPSGHELLAHISGKMRKRFIRLVVGDKVKIEMSPYDMTKARITFRIG